MDEKISLRFRIEIVSPFETGTRGLEHRRRERSLLDLVDTLKTLEKEIETRTLTMNALKRAKNQWGRIAPR